MRGALIVAPLRAADEPVDPDFLEFLGSVDSSEAGWHDYLAETDVDQVAQNAERDGEACRSARASACKCERKGRATMKSQCARLLMAVLLAQCAIPGARAAAGVADSPPVASAAAPAAPLAWKELQPNQQQLLQSYAQNWDSLPPARQQALARGARRWLSMDPAARAEARERFQAWQKLPEERRQLIRQRWEQFQQLDPQSKALVRQNFKAFMRLPPEQRQQAAGTLAEGDTRRSAPHAPAYARAACACA